MRRRSRIPTTTPIRPADPVQAAVAELVAALDAFVDEELARTEHAAALEAIQARYNCGD